MRNFLLLLSIIGLLIIGVSGYIFLQQKVLEKQLTEKINRAPSTAKARKQNQPALTPSELADASAQAEKERVQRLKKQEEARRKALENKRLDINGNLVDKEKFYQDKGTQEKKPYKHGHLNTDKNRREVAKSEVVEEKATPAAPKEYARKATFNIERGEFEHENTSDIPTSTSNPPDMLAQPFLLIAGSFSNPENAETAVQAFKQKGFKNALKMLSEKGLYLIVLEAFDNRQRATQQTATLKAKGIDCYVKTMY